MAAAGSTQGFGIMPEVEGVGDVGTVLAAEFEELVDDEGGAADVLAFGAFV